MWMEMIPMQPPALLKECLDYLGVGGREMPTSLLLMSSSHNHLKVASLAENMSPQGRWPSQMASVAFAIFKKLEAFQKWSSEDTGHGLLEKCNSVDVQSHSRHPLDAGHWGCKTLQWSEDRNSGQWRKESTCQREQMQIEYERSGFQRPKVDILSSFSAHNPIFFWAWHLVEVNGT